ncbi:hypothetical protein D3C80_1529640 [compost metagenome]
MEGAALADPQAQGGELGLDAEIVLHVDAGGIGLGIGLDVASGQGVDDGGFQAGHQLSHRELAAAHVHQHIEHQLAGAVIGHLAAAIALHHGDVTGGEQMLGLAGLALGVDGIVLHHPELVRRLAGAAVGEGLHGVPYRLVGATTQVSDEQLWLGGDLG